MTGVLAAVALLTADPALAQDQTIKVFSQPATTFGSRVQVGSRFPVYPAYGGPQGRFVRTVNGAGSSSNMPRYLTKRPPGIAPLSGNVPPGVARNAHYVPSLRTTFVTWRGVAPANGVQDAVRTAGRYRSLHASLTNAGRPLNRRELGHLRRLLVLPDRVVLSNAAFRNGRVYGATARAAREMDLLGYELRVVTRGGRHFLTGALLARPGHWRRVIPSPVPVDGVPTSAGFPVSSVPTGPAMPARAGRGARLLRGAGSLLRGTAGGLYRAGRWTLRGLGIGGKVLGPISFVGDGVAVAAHVSDVSHGANIYATQRVDAMEVHNGMAILNDVHGPLPAPARLPTMSDSFRLQMLNNFCTSGPGSGREHPNSPYNRQRRLLTNPELPGFGLSEADADLVIEGIIGRRLRR